MLYDHVYNTDADQYLSEERCGTYIPVYMYTLCLVLGYDLLLYLRQFLEFQTLSKTFILSFLIKIRLINVQSVTQIFIAFQVTKSILRIILSESRHKVLS